MTSPETPTPASAFTPKLVVGVAIIVVGLVLTLDTLGLVNSHAILRLWPLALVAMGIAKLRQEGTGSTAGWALVVVGTFLVIALVDGDHSVTLGPLLIVALGIFIVTKALKQNRGIPAELSHSDDFLQGTAIMGGFKRRVATTTFKGGQLTAIFGGYEVDLRQCALEGGQARLDIFVLFGGGEIRVPEGWEIVSRATAIAGAINDNTHHGPQGGEARPRLIITGLILFGGTEVKS